MLTVNQAVRDHQLSTAWEYQEVCLLCWKFFDAFRSMHFPDVTDCYFHVEPTNKKSRLVYSTGNNGIGAQHDCLLNDKWLGRPVYEIAAYVLHAIVLRHGIVEQEQPLRRRRLRPGLLLARQQWNRRL